ncbi:MAG: two-component regulator propeller domain-containing protein [Cyclobacteriaceae bacterium]
MRITFLVAFYLSVTMAMSQKDRIRFRHLSLVHGLSHVTVDAIAQDKNGLIWFGTTDGLNRYDGYKVEIFRNIPNDRSTIPSNVIKALYLDSTGDFWIGTYNGLALYNQALGCFQHFWGQGTNQVKVYSITEDNSGRLFLGTSNGVQIIDKARNQVVPLSENKVNGDVFRILIDSHQNLWIGTLSQGLMRYSLAENKVVKYDAADFPNQNVSALLEVGSNNILIGSNGGGLWQYNFESDRFTQMKNWGKNSLNSDRIISLHQNRSGDILMGTDDMGLIKTSGQEKLLSYKFSETDLDGISSTSVRWIYEDGEGQIWLGTWGGGISIHNPLLKQFTTYRHDPASVHSLGHNFVHAIFQENDKLWVGTRNGLNLMDIQNETFKRYYHDPLNTSSISNNYIKSIYKDSFGILWIGTQDGLNYGLNDTFQTFRTDPSNNESISWNDITFIFEDSDKDLWIGTWNGLNRFNRGTQDFERFLFDPNSTPDHHQVLTMVEDDNGLLWIGTYDGGLLKFDKRTGSYDTFRNDPNDINSLSHNRIWTLHKDKTGQIWAGTFGGGLNKLVEGEVTKFKVYGENDGLSSNSIIGIMSDSNNQLWISGNNGISHINPTDETFTNFDESDGLQGNHFNVAYHRNDDGFMFFGGSNGFNVFHPDSIVTNSIAPVAVLTTFELFNKPVVVDHEGVLRRPLAEKPIINLSHEHSVFTLGFSATSYVNPDKNEFAYQLAGFDQQWFYTNNERRYATYTNIPPGEYRFLVKASNNAGIWGEPAEIKLIIHPPWWSTIWFRSVLIISIVMGLVGFYNYRLRSIEKQKKVLEVLVEERTVELENQKSQAIKDKNVIEKQANQLKELDKVKTRFFANISHELRTPLTLMTSPVDPLIEGKYGPLPDKVIDRLEMIKRSGKDLLGLVEEILDLAKLEAGKMELTKNPVRIHSFLSEVLENFQSKAEQQQIKLEFDSGVREEISLLLDEGKVSKVINNLLSNALKFTPAGGSISVSLSDENGQYKLSVKDTGRGIYPDDLPFIFDRFYQSSKANVDAEGGTGIGLALSVELATLMEGSLTATSTLGEGSEFVFTFSAKIVESTAVPVAEGLSTNEIEEALESAVRKYSSEFDIDKPNMMLAEDHPEMRAFVAQIMEPYFNIYQAQDGLEGLQVLKEQKIDIGISDVMMPHMDGFELLTKAKEDDQLRKISMVMLTARSAEEDKLTALTLGVDDYITKPFSSAELLARVKNILENRINRKLSASEDELSGSSIDGEVIHRLKGLVENHLNDSLLTVPFMASEVALSERQLQRKLKQITGFSPNLFIREIRLTRAKRLLESRQVNTVAEAANKVGFDKPDYFSTQFSNRFGKLPSEYLKTA